MKPKPIIAKIHIKAGELTVPNRKFVLAALKQWPDGDAEMELRPIEERRRARQNNWLWGVCYKMIAAESGYTIDNVHELMKLRHNTGEVIDPSSGEEYKIGRTTTKLTVQQFGDYIESVMLDGAEWYGISWPEPRESEEYREAVRG